MDNEYFYLCLYLSTEIKDTQMTRWLIYDEDDSVAFIQELSSPGIRKENSMCLILIILWIWFYMNLLSQKEFPW